MHHSPTAKWMLLSCNGVHKYSLICARTPYGSGRRHNWSVHRSRRRSTVSIGFDRRGSQLSNETTFIAEEARYLSRQWLIQESTWTCVRMALYCIWSVEAICPAAGWMRTFKPDQRDEGRGWLGTTRSSSLVPPPRLTGIMAIEDTNRFIFFTVHSNTTDYWNSNRSIVGYLKCQ